MENSQRFVEYVENNISRRNQIIPEDLYYQSVTVTSFLEKESYGSYYQFDKSLFEYVQKNIGVKGNEG